MQTCVPSPSCPEAVHRPSEESELKTKTPRVSVTALGLLSKLGTFTVGPFKPYSLYPVRSRCLAPHEDAKPEALYPLLHVKTCSKLPGP